MPVITKARKVEVPVMDYAFPGVPAPFGHQIFTFDFILNTPRCFVYNDIGTGKTWSTVWAIEYLMKIGAIKNVLVVAPLSTLDVVWRRTFFHLDPSLPVDVLKGTASRRTQMLANVGNKGKVSIINPDGLHIIAGEKSLELYDMVVVDESAMFRKAGTRRSKALAKVCNAKRAIFIEEPKRVVMMSGSPCPEAPTDVWATARIVCPDRVPRYFGQMRDLLMRKVTQFKYVPVYQADLMVSEMLKGYVVRFKRDECLDLPPTHYVNHEVEATPEQKRLLKELKDEASVMLEAGEITAANEAVVRTKMLQICSGAVKYSDDEGRNNKILVVDCKPKFDALEELLEASDIPIIIYSNYTAVINGITEWLAEKKIPFGKVDGSVSTNKRLEYFDALQAGTIKVLVAHPKAMAHGITLTTSNVIVWWSPLDSHETHDQANGRITRPGQENHTYIITLVCSGLEVKVARRLETKQTMQGVLLEYLES